MYTSVPSGSSQYPEAQAELGGLYRLMKDPERAEKHLQISLGLAPDVFRTHAEMAMLRQSQERFEEALRSWTETVRLHAKFAPAWLQMGLCLETLDRKDEAIKAGQRAAELNPQLPGIRELLLRLNP